MIKDKNAKPISELQYEAIVSADVKRWEFSIHGYAAAGYQKIPKETERHWCIINSKLH